MSLLFLSQADASAQEATPISTLEEAQNSVWKIEGNLSRGTFAGTAFPIASHVFVTNYHVIAGMRNSSEIRLFREQTSLSFKRLLAVSALYDLAIFETQEPVSMYFEVIEERSEPDEDLFILGYPQRRFELIEKTGTLIHYENYDSFPVDHREDRGGASGSPILNRAIHVVGVLKGGVENFVELVRGSRVEELMEGKIGLECGELTVLKECVERGLEALKTTAEQGNAYAQNNLARMYENGEGVEEKDPKLALDWYQKAAAQGLADAQNNLARMYENGEGVEEKDPKLALDWYQKAAAQGLADAQYNLAVMYYTGVKGENGEEWIVEENPTLALESYQKAAEQGYAPAEYNLAVMYENGVMDENGKEIVLKDLDLAFFWYHKSAEQGYVLAQYNLAGMYLRGEGVEQSFAEAFKWYHKAAEQGDADAQYNLALMYYHGVGVEQSFAEAFKWYHKAAKQGDVDAQYSLAGMYKNGEGVEQSLEPFQDLLASYWYQKAAEQGHAEAQNRLLEEERNQQEELEPRPQPLEP